MELRTYTGFSGINYLECFVQSYCFINSKHKQTNDLFKYGILKDEFSGWLKFLCTSNWTFLSIFLSALTFQNSKSKDRFSKKGRYEATINPILVCNDVARVKCESIMRAQSLKQKTFNLNIFKNRFNFIFFV